MFNKNLRILAYSSSRSGNSGYLEPALPGIESLLGEKSLNIAFIPFALATEDYDGYTTNVKEAMSHLPHKIETVLPGSANAAIQKADVIMVGGGNTFKLLHDLYETGILEMIRGKIIMGIPYIGWSAGSNILSPGIFTTNDMPILQPKSFKALDLLPFQVNPHYNNELPAGHRGETRDQRLEEFLRLNPGEEVIGLPEGSGLLLQDGIIQLVGEKEAVHFSIRQGEICRQVLNNESLNKMFNS